MLSVVKKVFKGSEKDYAGRKIDHVIESLAARTGTSPYDWSYLNDEQKYENTVNGMKVYPHEVAQA